MVKELARATESIQIFEFDPSIPARFMLFNPHSDQYMYLKSTTEKLKNNQ